MDRLVVRNDKLRCGVEMEDSGCAGYVRGDGVQRRLGRKEMWGIGVRGKKNTVCPARDPLPVRMK